MHMQLPWTLSLTYNLNIRMVQGACQYDMIRGYSAVRFRISALNSAISKHSSVTFTRLTFCRNYCTFYRLLRITDIHRHFPLLNHLTMIFICCDFVKLVVFRVLNFFLFCIFPPHNVLQFLLLVKKNTKTHQNSILASYVHIQVFLSILLLKMQTLKTIIACPQKNISNWLTGVR